MNKKLEEIIECISQFKPLLREDTVICVWNAESTIEAFFGSDFINFKLEKGYRDTNEELLTVLKTGKQIYNKLPKEVFGVSIEGSITPIFDGKEIVGAVTYCVSSEEKETMLKQADNLSTQLVQTEGFLNHITEEIQYFTMNMNQVQEITDVVKAEIDEAKGVVAQIKKNANYSGILALNAAIESARAGEAGKGFTVVSEEMRKFSTLSGSAATKIQSSLDEIAKSLVEVKESITKSAEIAKEQTHSANGLNGTFEEVNHVANQVMHICKEVGAFLG